ncbi:hypothetical protein [Iamia sp.]|uniref:hypothetical protein n=1 Tax=Iamia sp. TaxID=2722710 RepID=UPI002BA6B8B7|nr:hypothetical protein [Iamia sp.]HXH58377.1 hypothetical protein [Iamia sp.]
MRPTVGQIAHVSDMRGRNVAVAVEHHGRGVAPGAGGDGIDVDMSARDDVPFSAEIDRVADQARKAVARN